MGKLDDTERPAPPPDREGQSEEPKRLGGFELLGRLGKGGMGTVLKARQVSMDRLVALKILPKKLAENETFVQRFVREARSAAHLRHPNIVQAFDVGVVDGYHFFAMEFVDGETLSDMIARDGPLEPSRALDIMKQVTSALAAAHEEGIVHRDIKPSNIMIDKKGEVRVTDFGLAKRTEGDVAVTADGTVLGSPGYVSPEMAKGGHADARSDLYSLGATVFCSLAGRPPFEGRNFSEVVVKQATEAPPPLASLAPRVDRRLCHVIDRLLRKNPEARYPSAKALLDDLNGLGKLQSVAAAARAEGRAMLREAPTLEMTEGKRREREAHLEAQRPKSNRTTLIAVGAIVAILAVAGIVLATRKPKDTATSVPEHRTPNTEHRKDLTAKPPAVAPKLPTPPEPPPAKPGEWVSLFDGKTLDGWKVAEEGGFAKHGDVRVDIGQITLEQGDPGTGIARQQEVPSSGYEVAFEAMRVQGQGDFGSVAFPVGRSACTLVLGGWGGDIVGLNFVDGRGADNNVTTLRRTFEPGRWVRVRLRVTPARIQAWLDDEAVVDLAAAGHWFDTHGWLLPLMPLGLYSHNAAAALRGLRLRALEAGEVEAAGAEGEELQAAELAIPARADWYHTGLLLTQGETYEITASGRWGTDLPVSHGPAGEPGTNEGQLLALVGDGQPIAVGERHSFAAPTTGMLYLGFRDRPGLYGDNWGCLRVTVKGPLVADKQARLLSRFSAPLASVEVSAQEDWAPTGLDLDWGDLLLLAATDTWSCGGQATDANGLNANLNGLRPGMLIGRIGEEGEPFSVGALHVLEAPDSGKLYLRMHALAGAGNSGSLNVAIRSAPRPDRGKRRPTQIAGGAGGAAFEDRVDAPGYLVGFRYTPGRLGDIVVGSLQPVYQTPAGVKRGRVFGVPGPAPQEVVAKAGYAVGGLVVKAGGFVNRFKIIFMRVRGDSLDPNDRYESEWIGGTGGGPDAHVGGSGARIVGIRGRCMQVIDAIGLIELAEGAERPMGQWVPLFDGKTLDGWRVIEEGVFARHGEVQVERGELVMGRAGDWTGIARAGGFPTQDFEIEIEAVPQAIQQDICSISFPLGIGGTQLAINGLGGRRVGLAGPDGVAPLNGTVTPMAFATGRAYRVRLRVTGAGVQAWIDEKQVIDYAWKGELFRRLDYFRPLSIYTVGSRTALRSIRMRRLEPQQVPAVGEFQGKPGEWVPLFDGKTLDGWRVVPFFPGGFGGRGGRAEVRDGHIVLDTGMPRTAIAWTRGFPTSDYEVRVEATRILGQDDFCSIVFPLGAAHCIWVVGAYGGATSGVEVLDNTQAHFNETTRRLTFDQGRWYQVRLRVTKAKIEGWIDDEKVFDTLTAGHAFALRDFAQPVAPFGICTWNTTAGLRNISVRAITPGPNDGPPPDEPLAGAKPVEAATLAVAAHANWFDTGLYVTGGKAYELSASGLWGTDPPSPTCGPEGMPYHVAARFPLPGIERKFSLIGRVGALGPPFQIGEKLALTPETTGRLYLRMNDPVAWDNWGSLRVAVAGPLLADADAPLLARFTNEVRKLSLDAKSDWADTGVAVQAGDRVLIAAASTWQAGPLMPPANADGYQEPLAFLRRGALVGKVGEEGRPFHVGQLLLLEATKAGKLYLAMNDDARDDNQGSLTVTVSSPPRPVAPGPPKPP